MRAWRSNPTWYTIVHRRKFERKGYRFGYRTQDLNALRESAQNEAAEGVYSMIKIVNDETNETIECFTKATK